MTASMSTTKTLGSLLAGGAAGAVALTYLVHGGASYLEGDPHWAMAPETQGAFATLVGSAIGWMSARIHQWWTHQKDCGSP